jgi:hypothetical protein
MSWIEMKKCIVCGKYLNDWFMKFISFIIWDSYNFKTCQSCRNLAMKGLNVDEIRFLEGLK